MEPGMIVVLAISLAILVGAGIVIMKTARMVASKYFSVDVSKANRPIYLKGWAVSIAALVVLFVFSFVSVLPKGSQEATTRPQVSASPVSKVENSGWDGSVRQAEQFIKNNLKDPSSYKAVNWGKVIRVENRYTVWVDFNAKNSFGAVDRDTWAFELDLDGKVTSVYSNGMKKQLYP